MSTFFFVLFFNLFIPTMSSSSTLIYPFYFSIKKIQKKKYFTTSLSLSHSQQICYSLSFAYLTISHSQPQLSLHHLTLWPQGGLRLPPTESNAHSLSNPPNTSLPTSLWRKKKLKIPLIKRKCLKRDPMIIIKACVNRF